MSSCIDPTARSAYPVDGALMVCCTDYVCTQDIFLTVQACRVSRILCLDFQSGDRLESLAADHFQEKPVTCTSCIVQLIPQVLRQTVR